MKRFNLFLLSLILGIIKYSVLGLLLSYNFYYADKIFKPIIETSPHKGWIVLVICILFEFLIFYKLIVGRLDIKWFDSRLLASRILDCKD
ncbi:hypothetical protein [Bacillus sp. EAC]|uniref:hypothetical protein n=1 Tax=Bacillus sp. EAC TaxID=1978338 RepID=UPI000B42EBBA|nr:hypothetical protein [Bacillus sp. EAC]